MCVSGECVCVFGWVCECVGVSVYTGICYYVAIGSVISCIVSYSHLIIVSMILHDCRQCYAMYNELEEKSQSLLLGRSGLRSVGKWSGHPLPPAAPVSLV